MKRTQRQISSDATYAPVKIDQDDLKESVKRYEAIRESVRKLVEEIGVLGGSGTRLKND
jgi:hypothetical protein